MFENLTADLRASQEDRVLEKNMGLWRVFFRMETPAIVCYRFGHWAEKVGIPVVGTLLRIAAGIFQRFVQILIGVYISPDAEIGPGLVIHTPFGIVVGPNKIGEHCTIQNVVVAANSLVLTDVPDNMTVIGVPARIRLPGGRAKRFKWQTVKQKEQGTNGKESSAPAPANGHHNSQPQATVAPQASSQPEPASRN